MQRETNTEYILSLSYGKDSIACLEAIKLLGYPLDRIVHAEVWATDTIPADLPPMVKFKEYADKIIEERYGIKVEHICAVRRGGSLPTNVNSTSGLTKEETKIASMASHIRLEHGVIADSRLMHCPQSEEKLTYEKLFYHVPKRRGGRRKSERWLATTRSGMRSELTTQTRSTQNNQFSDFQYQEELGATAISNLQPYGFPISIGQGNWCTGLKTKALKQLEKKQCVFGKARLHNGQENKYCAIPRNSSR